MSRDDSSIAVARGQLSPVLESEEELQSTVRRRSRADSELECLLPRANGVSLSLAASEEGDEPSAESDSEGK